MHKYIKYTLILLAVLITCYSLCYLSSIEAIERTLLRVPLIAHVSAFHIIPAFICPLLSILIFALSIKPLREIYRSIALPLITINIAILLFAPILTISNTAMRNDNNPSKNSLIVVSWNTQNTNSISDLFHIIKKHSPDVIVLPEFDESIISDPSQLSPYGIYESQDDGFTSVYDGSIAPTTVLVNESLGRIMRASPYPVSFGSVSIKQSDHPGIQIVGLHNAPPLPGLMGAWRTDLDQLKYFESQLTDAPAIIAGDFNATSKHWPLGALKKLRDSYSACSTQVGTWPAGKPGWMKSQIDHILITDHFNVTSCAMEDIGTSDHSAVIITLSY